MAKKIRVRKVPSQAYDPSRPPSSLLLSQVQQLQTAVFESIDSEGEAAVCIRTLTRLLEELRPQTAPCAHKDSAGRSHRHRARRKGVRHATGSRRSSAARSTRKR
jgi:hypothetical protein